MAIEQRPLSEVSNRKSPLSAPLVDRTKADTINLVAGTVKAVVPIVDKFLVDRTLTRLDKEVSAALADTSFDSIDLESQEVLTPEQTRSLLTSERGTSNFVRQIDALAASQRQGRGAKGQLDRADAVVKKFINEFPGREAAIREHAQNALGLKQGVNAALAQAREAESFQRGIERNIKTSFVQRAIDEGQGYVALFQDGSVDVETTANRGRILAALDEQLGFKATSRRSRGAGGARGGELSQTEIEDVETRDLQGYAAERMATYVPSLTTQLRALVNSDEFSGNEVAQQQEMQRSLALRREEEIQNIELKYRGEFSDKAIDETIAQINDQFDRLDGLAAIPASQLADTIEILSNQAKLRAHTLLPTVMVLKEAGLDKAITTMDGPLAAIFTDELQSTLANEIRAVTAGVRQVTSDDIVNDTASVAKGTKSFADMPVEQRNKAIQLSAAYMNEFVKRRNSLEETEKVAFLNMYAQTAASGLQVESTNGLNNAVKIFAQKGYAETLKQIASDPSMKDRADLAGQVANNLALKAFHRSAPEMLREVQGNRNFNMVYDPSLEQIVLEPASEKVTFRRVTPESITARISLGMVFSPSLALAPTTTSTINVERLTGMNNALNVLVDMKDFSIHKDSFAGMSDRQIKEMLSAAQGIPIKGGRSSSLGGLTDTKIEELKDVNRAQQVQTGTVVDTDRVFTFDPASDSFVQEE